MLGPHEFGQFWHRAHVLGPTGAGAQQRKPEVTPTPEGYNSQSRIVPHNIDVCISNQMYFSISLTSKLQVSGILFLLLPFTPWKCLRATDHQPPLPQTSLPPAVSRFLGGERSPPEGFSLRPLSPLLTHVLVTSCLAWLTHVLIFPQHSYVLAIFPSESLQHNNRILEGLLCQENPSYSSVEVWGFPLSDTSFPFSLSLMLTPLWESSPTDLPWVAPGVFPVSTALPVPLPWFIPASPSCSHFPQNALDSLISSLCLRDCSLFQADLPAPFLLGRIILILQGSDDLPWAPRSLSSHPVLCSLLGVPVAAQVLSSVVALSPVLTLSQRWTKLDTR